MMMKDKNITKDKFIKNFKEIEALTSEEKISYFEKLREQCQNRRVARTTNRAILGLIGMLSPFFRKYDIEIQGAENIPDDTAVFLCNHSNSHDFFTIREVFYNMNRRVAPLGAWDGLNFFSRLLFRWGDVTLIKRDNSESKRKGILDYCSKILSGKNGFVFGEATWNLHPYKPMQDVKAGIAEIAMITGKAVVPTIFEYVEVDHTCNKEKDLYRKCIVSFGKPVIISAEKGFFEQTEYLQKLMETMRKNIWEQEKINKNDFTPEEIERYLYHTYLKKFKAFGFTYNSKSESSFLLRKRNAIENEYCLDSNGKFVPGIIEM